MIRLATKNDLDRIVIMGQRFRAESEYKNKLSESVQTMQSLATLLIENEGILVSENHGQLTGMIGFIVYNHFISKEKIGGEVFWWVEPEHRGDGIKLLRAAEKAVRKCGAQRMQMIAPNAQVAHVYERLGYGYVESTYQRNL